MITLTRLTSTRLIKGQQKTAKKNLRDNPKAQSKKSKMQCISHISGKDKIFRNKITSRMRNFKLPLFGYYQINGYNLVPTDKGKPIRTHRY